ncbi:MAG TPA: hypothetical protein VL284_07130 [Thermoanaerobaculia bacterium]|nr:hypothetical protein [Thermoanaerobaculia bacterium]
MRTFGLAWIASFGLLACGLAVTTISIEIATAGAVTFSMNRLVTGIIVLIAQSFAVALLLRLRRNPRSG